MTIKIKIRMIEKITGHFQGNYDGKPLIISIKVVSGFVNSCLYRDTFITFANVL